MSLSATPKVRKRLTDASKVEVLATSRAGVSKAANPAPQKTKGSGRGKVLIALGSILVASFILTRGGDYETLDLSDEDTQFLVQNSEYSRQMFWRNEWPSWLEKVFCRGYVSSTWCTNKPLHPFRQQAELEGKNLKFPEETDHRVIERTYEVPRTGF